MVKVHLKTKLKSVKEASFGWTVIINDRTGHILAAIEYEAVALIT
jgi:hypothetical protein